MPVTWKAGDHKSHKKKLLGRNKGKQAIEEAGYSLIIKTEKWLEEK